MDRVRLNAVRYAIGLGQALPKRWRDHLGPIRVMGGPHEGYVMVRRPRAEPFVIKLAELLNAEQHPVHGPFEFVERSRPLPSEERR